MRPDIDALVMARKEGFTRFSTRIVVYTVTRMDKFVVLHELRCVILVTNVVSDPHFCVLELQFGVLAELLQIQLDFMTLLLNVMDQFGASLRDVVFALVVFDGNKLCRASEVDQLGFFKMVLIFVVHQGFKPIFVAAVDLGLCLQRALSLIRHFDVVFMLVILRVARRI